MEIWGIYHTAKKHSDELYLSVLIPPWAWYRSIEYWWHDDFSNVNWDTQVPSDIKVCIYFLNLSTHDTTNVYKMNKDLQEFSNTIHKYPPEKLLLIEKGTRVYIRYANIITNELFTNLMQSAIVGPRQLVLSDSSDKVSQLLIKYGLKEDVESIKNQVAVVNKTFLSKSVNQQVYLEKFNEYLPILENNINKQALNYSQTFKSIFNKTY